MATSVIANGPAHFSQGSEVFPDMYPNYSNYENFPSGNQHGYVYNAEQQPLSYTSAAESWPSQAHALRRVSSRSPNLQFERTPIRHHKPSISRSRSTSKPDALLVYATEQSLQSQPHSTATTPSIPQTTPTTSPALYPSQAFASPAINSPFVQHPQFYDSQTTPFPEMHGQTNAHGHAIPEYFTQNRTDMHIPSVANTGLTPQDAMYLQSQAQARSTGMSGLTATPMGFQSMTRPLESTPGTIEVSSSRNKPQCWDHGCNGRQFSTFSNLLRHQREKSGTAAKARCPHCGTEFTRTTARNGHMYGGKCKGMPDAARRSPSMGDGNSDNEGPGRL